MTRHLKSDHKSAWPTFGGRLALLMVGAWVLFCLMGGPMIGIKFKFTGQKNPQTWGLLNSALMPHYFVSAHSEIYYDYLYWWAGLAGYSGDKIPHAEYAKQWRK